MATEYQNLSLWWDTPQAHDAARAALGGDLDVDVVIVGAGYTGLWSAHYLHEADPHLRICVIEREVAGFGASGRNGGWCSGLFAVSEARLRQEAGAAAADAMRHAMYDSVDEVGRVAAACGIDCHFAKGGIVQVARNGAQLTRARHYVDQARRFGIGPDDFRLLDQAQAQAHLGATAVLGGTFSPHGAAIQPALLARGLARHLDAEGVAIYEHTPALSIDPGTKTSRPCVHTPYGSVRADRVVLATEAWTSTLPGLRRAIAPVYSLMLATEPLATSFWTQAGLGQRETFSDFRHVIIYGQRTADDRIAFGGRGAPYHFGSRMHSRFERDGDIHSLLRGALVELFPDLGSVEITHTWGGAVGVARDWHPSVSFDPVSGLARAGAYVGDGVSTTNLAGRTLRDLLLGNDSDLVHLPWVNHRSKNWEYEPLRWLGVNAGLRIMAGADESEQRKNRPSKRAAVFARVTGD